MRACLKALLDKEIARVSDGHHTRDDHSLNKIKRDFLQITKKTSFFLEHEETCLFYS